ncbi:MAG: DUF302 domain-containing protein [Ilumatobacteraceae bacterium]
MTPITTVVDLDIAEAEALVRESLAQNGFGVLTEIDVAAIFKTKLGIDRSPLKILGACNPDLAHQALSVDPDTALVLPCNVVLEATEHGTTISAADPHDIITNPDLFDLADDAAAKLRSAIDNLGSSNRNPT